MTTYARRTTKNLHLSSVTAGRIAVPGALWIYAQHLQVSESKEITTLAVARPEKGVSENEVKVETCS